MTIPSAVWGQPFPRPQTVRLERQDDGRIVRFVEVPVSPAGILDRGFLNSANPPDLLADGVVAQTFLEFTNRSTQQDLVLVIGSLQFPLPQNGMLRLSYEELVRLGGASFEIRANGVTVTDGVGHFRLPAAPTDEAPKPPLRDPLQDAKSRDPGTVPREQEMPAPPGGLPMMQPQLVTRVQLDGTGVRDWNFRNLRNPPYLLKELVSTQPLVIPRAAELRKVLPAATQADLELLARLDLGVLEFLNDSLGRTFSITFEIPRPPVPSDFEQETGLTLGKCLNDVCKIVLNVPFLAPKLFPIRYFVKAKATDATQRLVEQLAWLKLAQPPVSFSVNFFDDNATPAEASGYFTLVPLSQLTEPSSKATWLLSPTIAGQRDPLVPDSASYFTTAETQYLGDIRRQFTEKAQLQFKATLGSRADATVTFLFKNGTVGEKDQNGSVTTPTFQINVSGINGIRLSFGRFLFTSPVDGLAVKEQGEGFRLDFRNKVAFGHIIRRESLDGTPDTGNRDSKAIVVEFKNLLPRGWTSIRNFNVTSTLGRDRKPTAHHWYSTTGIDTQFSVPNSAFSGTMAYYHSERRPRGTQNDPVVTKGRGDVGFITMGYVFLKPPLMNKPQNKMRSIASIRGEFGVGSGGSLLASDEDRGFLGETAAYSPDVIFLSRFAGKLRDIGPRITGLRKKKYVAGVYQEERFTPLGLIAQRLSIPPSDIESRLMRVSLRSYVFNDDLGAGDDTGYAGYELSGDSEIETPAGVRSKLSMAIFKPGSAVKGYFKKDYLFSITASVTLTLGN